MRRGVVLAAAVMVGCGSPADPPAASTTVVPTVAPANITRVRAALPAGYEVGNLDGPVSAVALWGFGTGWTADPPQCAALADPAPTDPTARGLSASGPGGTLFVVAAVDPAATSPTGLTAQCDRWTMAFGHTDAQVELSESPVIEGAQTVAWRALAKTAVESGHETTATAFTATAFVEGHVVVVTLITDPGSPHPPLDPRQATDLLTAAVAALRGREP